MTQPHRSRSIVLLLAMTLLLIVAPTGAPVGAAGAPARATGQPEGAMIPAPAVSVVVPVGPYVLIVDRITAGRVEVHTLVPSGRSPHTYSPTPQQIAALARADVLFHVGLELEQGLVPKLQELGENLLVVDLTAVEPDPQHAGARAHDHEAGHDPHVWLDPDSVIRQARLMAETLAHADPSGALIYAARCDSLERDLSRLDAELTLRLAPFAGSRFYVFHPAFGHFADAYGLEQIAIESSGKEPSAKRLAELMNTARGDDARVIIAQPQHSDATVRTLAREIDAEIVSIDPLAYDLFATLRALADAVAPDSAIAPGTESELP